MLIFQKELLLQYGRVFPELQVTLIEILLRSIFLSSFGQPQQQIILNILQLNRRYPTLDHSLPKTVDMALQ